MDPLEIVSVDLPRGWHWKSDPVWENVRRCASDGNTDVWLCTDGTIYTYGPAAAPARVYLAVAGLTLSVG